MAMRIPYASVHASENRYVDMYINLSMYMYRGRYMCIDISVFACIYIHTHKTMEDKRREQHIMM